MLLFLANAHQFVYGQLLSRMIEATIHHFVYYLGASVLAGYKSQPTCRQRIGWVGKIFVDPCIVEFINCMEL